MFQLRFSFDEYVVKLYSIIGYMKVSCIIPFYNEGDYIINVAGAILSSRRVSEIVFVDDGSTDGGHQLLKTTFPNTTILRQKNEGKLEAIKLGLSKTTGNTILLLDADYKYLTPGEIDRVIDVYFANNLDLLLVKVKGGNSWFDRLLQKEIVLTGFRILKKDDLFKVLSSSAKGYQLEVAINKYALESGKKIAWIEGKAKNTHKAKKWGLVNGLMKSIQMEISIFKYVGIIGYINQMSSIPKNKLNRCI